MTDTTLPYIPETITVHLGAPNQPVENVTVTFQDYIKNVASSEIYPTWDNATLRANILSQISFALNKIYLEYYPSRGYDFNITSFTAYDQAFIQGRDIFENIGLLVDELFQSYIRREGTFDPLDAAFCNGTNITCEGLSQWGSQSLAMQGYSYMDILKYYFGDDIEIFTDTPVRGLTPSYPGTSLRLGSAGEPVLLIQGALSRIGRNYPAIPKITPVDGLFCPGTESAVLKFQQLFNLKSDGIVGIATWNQIFSIYAAVIKLAELRSDGQRYLSKLSDLPGALSLGSSGDAVYKLQYMLDILSDFIPEIPVMEITGQYDTGTRNTVQAFQRYVGFTPSGIAGDATWGAVYNRYSGVLSNVLDDNALFPQESVQTVHTIADVQRALQIVAPVFAALDPPRVTGVLDRNTTRALAKLQNKLKLRPTGQLDPDTRRYLSRMTEAQAANNIVRFRQYPGHAMYLGQRDSDSGKERAYRDK